MSWTKAEAKVQYLLKHDWHRVNHADRYMHPCGATLSGLDILEAPSVNHLRCIAEDRILVRRLELYSGEDYSHERSFFLGVFDSEE